MTPAPPLTTYSLEHKKPKVSATAYIAPGAIVVGDVEIGPGSSIWFNAVLRGDGEPIRVGDRTNIQDGAVLHTDPGFPCLIANDVTVGHGAIVHGAVVEDAVTIGMGAVLLSGCRIGKGAVVAAGALVTEGMAVAAGTLVMGSPARQRRAVTDDEAERFAGGASHYVANGERFATGLKPVGVE